MTSPPAASAAVHELGIPPETVLDVRRFGAVGDGRTIDSGAINRSIAAASARGGGTIWFPPGTYLSYSIRLRSRIRLYLDPGATIVAANPPANATQTDGYDPPEAGVASRFPYQDFGHSHWHNSLIWGEEIRNCAIEGQGVIWGRGLVNGDFEPGHPPAAQPGVANKAIALLRARNVVLRDFSVLEAGHFAVLATGTEHLRAERLTIDTNRDGLNFDCCHRIRVTGCTINTPNDDAIALKSSYALGRPAVTRDVVIRDCVLSGGYEAGTLADRRYRRLADDARSIAEHYTCRIKFGTESNGGFQDVAIRNVVMRGSRGIAIVTVDGGTIQGVSIQGLTLYDVRSAPLFLRLGARLNGPPGALPGGLRDVTISDVYCEQYYTALPIIISGIPGHPIRDVALRHIHMRTRGGGTARMASVVPPEAIRSYPEPGGHVECFGHALPAAGLFARHVSGLQVRKFTLECLRPDHRPAVWLQDVAGGTIDLRHCSGIGPGALFRLRGAVRKTRLRYPGSGG